MGSAVKIMGSRTRAHRPPRERVIQSPIDAAQGFEVAWQQVAPLFEAARPYAASYFVYVIGEEDCGPIKIGMSQNPISRLRDMQVGNPRRLRIEFVLMGCREVEKFMHDRWAPFAIFSARTARKAGAPPGTEWFRGEIRERLFPVMDLAVAGQIQRLAQKTDVTSGELVQILRIAHCAHGVDPKPSRDVAHHLVGR